MFYCTTVVWYHSLAVWNRTSINKNHVLTAISAGIAAMSAGSATSQLNQITSLPAQQGAEAEDSEFDMFAQARNVTYETSKKG